MKNKNKRRFIMKRLYFIVSALLIGSLICPGYAFCAMKKEHKLLIDRMPGNTLVERTESYKKLIEDICLTMGMDALTQFTNVPWYAKLVTGNWRLYLPDLRELCQKEGLIKFFTSIQSLLSQSSGSTLST